jgi:hypothetical protein
MIRASFVMIAIAAAGGCSIDHRSGDFECTRQQDCNGGRICDDGFCIDPHAADAPVTDRPDGPNGRPDARQTDCPPECTSCNLDGHTCVIDCSVNATLCEGPVACPSGYSCDIRCNTQNSCRNGVDCTAGKDCAITCSGNSSCRNLECGQGACDVACTGFQSCRAVDCGNSCACDVTCTGPQSCSDGIFCTSFDCDTGLGCSSLFPGCNVCPPGATN